MAKLVYGLMQSLDGYVDHMKLGPPSPEVSRHFKEEMRGLTGLIYGRRMYEIMSYWDTDLPDWDAEDHSFAAVYRSTPKWVMSRSLKSVGRNATLVAGDLEKTVRKLKAEPPHTPIARARSRGSVKVLVMIDIATGLSIDPPSACSIRNRPARPSLGARLHSSEPSVNSDRPTWKVRRRPSRSAVEPDSISRLASTSV